MMLAEFATARYHETETGQECRVMRPQSYCRLYEELWTDIRTEVKAVLEVGVYEGGGLLMWERFFPHATIVGIDIRKWCRRYEGGRRVVRTGNQHNTAFLAELMVEFGRFDIVIDDGSHHWEDQRTTLDFFWDKPWRFYVVEDVQSSYVPHDWEYYAGEPSPQSFMSTAYNLIDRMHCQRLNDKWPAKKRADYTVRRVTMIPGLCVFEREDGLCGQ